MTFATNSIMRLAMRETRDAWCDATLLSLLVQPLVGHQSSRVPAPFAPTPGEETRPPVQARNTPSPLLYSAMMSWCTYRSIAVWIVMGMSLKGTVMHCSRMDLLRSSRATNCLSGTHRSCWVVMRMLQSSCEDRARPWHARFLQVYAQSPLARGWDTLWYKNPSPPELYQMTDPCLSPSVLRARYCAPFPAMFTLDCSRTTEQHAPSHSASLQGPVEGERWGGTSLPHGCQQFYPQINFPLIHNC